MKNIKCINKLFGVLAFLFVILACVASFGYSGFSYSVNSYYIMIFVIILLASYYLNKDDGGAKEVVGGFIFYIFITLVSAFLYVLNSINTFILNFREDGLENKLRHSNAKDLVKNTEKLEDLREVISNDLFGKTIDIISMILAITFITFAVITIINILKEKDYEKTFIGKKTTKVINLVEPNQNKEE